MNIPLFGPASSGLQWLTDRVWRVEHAFERANAQTKHAQGVRTRIIAIMAGLGLGVCVVGGFALKAAVNDTFSPASPMGTLAGGRAPLQDRNGELLAADVFIYDLFVNPADMTAGDRELVRKSLPLILPKIAPQSLERVFSQRRRLRLTGGISEADRQRLLDYGLPGLSFEPQRVRDYPLGETAAHYIGMTERGGGGLSGAERALDTLIRESAGANMPVRLAIDLRIQGTVENELRAGGVDQRAISGVGIVTNVRTGEVLAMASWPDFDLSRAGQYQPEQRRNVAAANVYETGSIFKLISMAAGIDSGKATLDTRYDATQPYSVGSRRIHDFHAENRVITLEEVFLASSNIGTTLIAHDVGIDEMTRYYKDLGLFRAANIELNEAARPILPRRWSQDALASSSFGHAMSISPLSYAEAAGAVLNGGWLRPLTISRVDPSKPLPGTQVLKAETSRTMLDLMRQNVIHGTGGHANAQGLRVGGKTGSAEKPGKGGYDRTNLISSFVAVFPTDGPVDGDRYLVLIMYDSPQGSPASGGSRLGGAVSAPVAGRVIARIAPFVGVTRRDDIFAERTGAQAPTVVEEQTGGGH